MAISNVASGLRPGVCTSTTRPSAPYTGQIIYETDTGYLRVWDGSAWDYLSQSQNDTTNLPISNIGAAWTSYTPTIKGGATTVTATINYAKYSQIQKTVFVQVRATVTSAGAANGIISISLPSGLNPINQSDIATLGTFTIKDTGTALYMGAAICLSNVINGIAYNSPGLMGANVPSMTLANTDEVGISVVYEVA